MRTPSAVTRFGILASLAFALSACDGGGADQVLGNSSLFRVPEPGVNLSAAPDTVILDPNDPAAQRDPVTHVLIDTVTISALVLDSSLKAVAAVGVTFTTSAGVIAPTTPVNTDTAGIATATLVVDSVGPRIVTVTAVSGTYTKSIDVLVDIAPTANAGEDQTIACPAPATLDGSASTDPNSTTGTNDDITAFEWFLGDSLVAEGEVTEARFPVGINVVRLRVTDAVGASNLDSTVVTVIDTVPPVVSLRMSPTSLWPPNHKMKTINAILNIQDCDPNPVVELVSVTSNEPVNGTGDGDTAPDIGSASLGTDDRSLQVRAERAGTGSGRIYTFVYRVTDASGNATEATATVAVPHDRGH